MTETPTLLPPDIQLGRDPLARIAVSAAPVVLEGRYRLLMRALWQLRHLRKTRWALGLGSAAVMLVLAFLAVRHFATTSWPLSQGKPGLLLAAGLLLLLAQALKAFGWARLFTTSERPSPLALVAGNGGAALIGVVLPGRFDDAMRIAVVRRYPGCPAGLRAISLSLVMLGLIDSAALAPLAAVAVAFPGAGIAARVALAVVAGAGIAAAAVIVALPRLAGSERALRFRLGRWLSPRTTSLDRATQVGVRLGLLARPRTGLLHPPRHARTGLLVPTRASVSLRRCRGRSAADRASGRSHPGRRRNRRARRLGCRSIAGACCLCLRGRSGSLLRSSRPALRPCLVHWTVAPVRSDHNLIASHYGERESDGDGSIPAAVPSSARRSKRPRSKSRQLGMEPLWSPVVATVGNRWQIG
jgi:hypothetical protein